MASLNSFMRRILGGGATASAKPSATPGATAAIPRGPNVSSPYNARVDTTTPRSAAVPATGQPPAAPPAPAGAVVASMPNTTAPEQPDTRSVLGAGPSVYASASPFRGRVAPMTFPIPLREGAVPGSPLDPQPDLPLPRRLPGP